MKASSLALLLIILLFIQTKAQDKSFRPTYNYDGYIQLPTNRKLPIKLNFLVLTDSTIFGNYYYKPQNGSLKLSGIFNKDYSISFFEWDNKEHNTGRFDGQVSKDRHSITGTWTSADKKHNFPFSLSLVTGMKSYWDYIRKYRALKEYHHIDSALKEPEKVLSLDLGNQGHSKIPKAITTLSNMLSISLLGNNFKTFPVILAKLPQLEEVSFASNNMQHIGPEIGE